LVQNTLTYTQFHSKATIKKKREKFSFKSQNSKFLIEKENARKQNEKKKTQRNRKLETPPGRREKRERESSLAILSDSPVFLLLYLTFDFSLKAKFSISFYAVC
jgi:hypothetical protein